MPWLMWCYDRQRWPRRELIVVDSSPVPLRVPDREDIRVVTAPPGTGIAEKRNTAIRKAHGEIVTWFDDDDWQHPRKLEWLAGAMGPDVPYCGSCRGWFVNLMGDGCSSFRGSLKSVLFNSAGFRREAILNIRFPERVKKASDTKWMQALEQRHRNGHVVLDHEVMFFWLCHRRNISNPTKSRRFTKPLRELKHLVGVDGWGDTDHALESLRERLRPGARKATARRATGPGAVASKNSHRPFHDTKTRGVEDKDTQPPAVLPAVSLMIKATVMDTAYLDTMVRHMVSQALFDFDETLIIVDRRLSDNGKYLGRFRTGAEELDTVLQTLVTDGVVQRVVDVDYGPARIAAVMHRYFGKQSRIPLHAATGGPIYATLFGLETVQNRHVLQMDADIFFYAKETSWVAESLKRMGEDENLWLMMTHPGPPAGPIGASLGPRNARLAQWDSRLGIWRFKTATTRYFLCDRHNLRGRLQTLRMGRGMAPLEQIISQALKRHGAYRGALGNLKSWHLHAWHHGEPFPQWVKPLAQAIKAGRYPAAQRGQYDLRLDVPKVRREWQQILRPAPSEDAVKAPQVPSGGKSKEPAAGTAPGHAPLTVVIPVRDRAGRRLNHTLAGLNWQTAGSPAQVLVVSHGSKPEINRELSDTCNRYGCQLLSIGDPKDPWNKPFALNVGIRASVATIPLVMTMDADMILAPNFLSSVIERLKRNKAALILCQSSDLPQHVLLDGSAERLGQDYSVLKRQSTLRPKWGPGGIQAARRSFFFEIRGYDEDLLWWGAMDRDLVQRARIAGLAVEWLDARTSMLHQWHPRKHSSLSDAESISEAKRAWTQNHDIVHRRKNTLARNPTGWGEIMN